MSVINTMLKNLDARGVQAQPAGMDSALPRPPAARRASTSAWRLPALLIGGGLVVVFAAFADWPRLMGRSASTELAVATPDTETTVAAAPAPALDPAPEPTPPPPATAAVPVPVETATPAPQRLALAAPAVPKEVPAPSVPATAPVDSGAATAKVAADVSLPMPVALPARIEKRLVQQTPEQRAQALHARATELALAGQRHTALVSVHQALTLDPRHAPARLLAAVLEHETGANARAIQLLNDGLVLHPRDGAQALLLARLLVGQGSNREALAALEQHAVTGSDADGLRGGIQAQLGDFKASLAAYESAARQQPGNPMWWFGLGVALDSEGMGARARQAYAKAQALGLPRPELAAYADSRMRSLD